jgi:high-affinity Fe2+/Pb2+ permease
MNDRKFEDRERTLGEILYLFYETLYLWTVAYQLVKVTSLFVLLFLVRWFLLYTSCVRRIFLNYLKKKKKTIRH